MIEFLRAGGVPMLLVLLLGCLALLAAIAHVRKPAPGRLRVYRALATATRYSVAGGVLSDLATVMWTVPKHPEWIKEVGLPFLVMRGVAESLTPAIVGLTLLALSWAIVAVGLQRHYIRRRTEASQTRA